MNAIVPVAYSKEFFYQNSEEAEAAPKKDLLDRLQDCASNRDDLNDYFVDPVAHLLDWWMHLPLDERSYSQTKRIRQGVDVVASVLGIPSILDHVNKFKRHVYALQKAWDKHPNLQDQKVSHVSKKATLDLLKIANNTSETTTFLHNVELIDLGESLPQVEGFFHASNLVIDGWDIVNQKEKLDKYQKTIDDTSSKSTKRYFEQKKNISYLNIARDVFSLGISIIGLFSLFYAAFVQSLLFIPPLALTLSTIYLVLSIWVYISKQDLEEQKKPKLVKI